MNKAAYRDDDDVNPYGSGADGVWRCHSARTRRPFAYLRCSPNLLKRP